MKVGNSDRGNATLYKDWWAGFFFFFFKQVLLCLDLNGRHSRTCGPCLLALHGTRC